MAAQVLSFFQRSPRYKPAPAVDWTQQELAEFYRVESALIRAGIRVGTDRGLSDENEPWFVFYRADDGEVVIHFARIDGEYLIAGPAYEEVARGFDFSALVRNMVARHPLIRRSDTNSNLSIHPAALLVAVVGTAFFKTGEARAAETGAANPAQAGHNRPALLSSSSNAGLTNGVAPVGFQQPAYDSVQVPANQAVLILAAALLASDYGVDTASLDASARAAISAAAASLDFGGVTMPSHGQSSGDLFAATAHATVVDNTPAQTVSSVLSLVAILSSMPHSEAAATDGLIGGGGGGGGDGGGESANHDSGFFALPPPSSDAANWAIDVRLGLALDGLPSVEAVQLIRGLAGETGAQKISVIEVAKLPDILAELISKGDHFNVTPPTAPTAPDAPTVTPPAAETPTTPTEGAVTPTPSEPATTPPIQTPAEPTTPPSGFVPPDLVKQFIDYFIAHTGGIEVMTHGVDIVMFDARILHDAGAATHLTSMTFHFEDGGSISLVGNHSSFLNDGNLV